MAERRMLSSKVVCSDAFISMPFSAQALYVQLNMEADDDGFSNKAKRIQRSIGATDADLTLLIERRFVLGFPNGVIVIKHWRMNNQIRKDRYTATQYQKEFATLEIRDDGAYTEKASEDVVVNPATTWQPNGNQMATTWQPSIGKDSLVQFSLEDKGVSDSGESEQPPAETKTDFQQIVDLYNSICKSFPTVRSLSEARKKAIRARLKTYTIDDFRTVFESAEASSFLKGKNDRNWTATFDWLISDKNMAKVLEGNYADKPRYGRKEIVPSWCGNRPVDDDELSAIQRLMADTKTVGSDPELAQRAEQLKQSLQTG